MKRLLITFGCSWTAGVGVNYEPGMNFREFEKTAWDQQYLNQYSFRSILCDRFDMHNINFSAGGSSNQQQFRAAEEFFGSEDFYRLRDSYTEILVLWGLTSVFRNEAYFADQQMMKSFFYSDRSSLSKAIIANHFDSQHEINLISKKLNFWNKFFDAVEIKNLWFDTFNHHDYHNCIPPDIQERYVACAGESWPSWEQFKAGDFAGVPEDIQEEILSRDRWNFYEHFGACGVKRLLNEHACPRDLLSQLAIQHGMIEIDDQYHLSAWSNDSDRISFLVEKGMLNPFSYHPTKQSHECIAEMLAPALGLV